MYIWGITKKYKALSWAENFLSGHVCIGRITIYGENAMRWAVNIRTRRWGSICFNLPTVGNLKRRRMYFYLSPNGTPWASTLHFGPDYRDKALSIVRKHLFGHGFNTEQYREELRRVNDSL